MIEQLSLFRKILDDMMLSCLNSRIVIYGYDSYTGRFLKWYAEYYHSISVDFFVSEDMTTGRGYELEVFRPSIFDFGYKDVKNAVIWLAQPLTDVLRKWLDDKGYVSGKTYFDFYGAIYGEDVIAEGKGDVDAFRKSKTGRRDIQFLEYLEWKYDCNFLTPIAKSDFEVVDGHGARYSCSTQKEIFPMLDRCHFHPDENDAVFDFGCGKGGALVTFLDYGFKTAGGVEYEPKTYAVAQENMDKLGIRNVELICGDARNVTNQLDKYSWFYFFFPFDKEVFEVVINNIKESYKRCQRKIHLIYFTAMDYSFIESTGIFRLVNQFTVDSRQRVVGIFESC